MLPDVQQALAGSIGLPCHQLFIGEHASLSIGLGRSGPAPAKMGAKQRYEWEMGTYSRGWRVLREGRIVCGALDLDANEFDISHLLSPHEIGCLVAVQSNGCMDVTLQFEHKMEIQFLTLMVEDDELFHAFGPQSIYVQFDALHGWQVGKSNRPWPNAG